MSQNNHKKIPVHHIHDFLIFILLNHLKEKHLIFCYSACLMTFLILVFLFHFGNIMNLLYSFLCFNSFV